MSIWHGCSITTYIPRRFGISIGLQSLDALFIPKWLFAKISKFALRPLTKTFSFVLLVDNDEIIVINYGNVS